MARSFGSIFAIFVFVGCAAPRAVLWDGRSVEAGHVEGHFGMVVNAPTATVSAAGTAGLDAARGVANGNDSLTDSAMYRHAVRALVAGGLDMPGASYVGSLHVGLGKGFELGYRREGAANAFALRWQFLSAERNGWNAGTAVQYSSQSYDLPSALGKLQDFLGYKFDRKDVSVPVVFSRPFGENGKFGSIAMGLVGGWTQVEYGFDPNGIYRRWGGKVEVLDTLPEQSSSFFSYGTMFLVRGGYKYVWLKFGLTTLYQDYGSFRVPGTDPIALSGFSILPSIGVEFRI
jgi:hypothetical protein